MRTRPLGRGGPDVSVVGFGGMRLSIPERPDEERGVRVLHTALDAGMTLIDTADVYCLDHTDIGHNERLIARTLESRSGDRDRITVATKGGMRRPDGRWTRDARPDHLRAACDASLRSLGVERIDLYQLHAPDPEVPLEESVGALADLRAAGKIDRIGLSNVTAKQIRTAERIVPVASVQNRLNPFFREALEEGVVAHCEENGIAFLAYSPVGAGRLNRKLPDHPEVGALAEERDISPHALVLAWVLAQGSNVIVIPGARTESHARDSATAGDLALDAAARRTIDEAHFSTA